MKKQQIKVTIRILILTAIFIIMSGSVFAFYKPSGEHVKKIIKPEKMNYVEDEIIIKFRPGVTQAQVEELSEGWGILDTSGAGYRIKTRRFKAVSSKISEQLLNKLKNSSVVEYVEPNYIAQAQFVPNDTYYGYQWNFKNLNMENMWDVSTGQGVVVAVVDTGVAYTDYGWSYRQASDLAQTKFERGWDFVNNDAYPLDDNGHGTHIAGTIAGSTDNGMGVSGIAYNSTIMPIKVLGADGVGTYADIADGIVWAVDNGAQVINLSLGGQDYSNLLKEAVEYAHARGVVVVAAAGNAAAGEVYYPAAYDDYVLAVGAVDAENKRAPYSNWGESLDLVAPGGNLSQDVDQNGYGDGILQQTISKDWWGRVDTKNFGYFFYQGTSQATAHVAGVAALLMANGRGNSLDVQNALKQTSLDLGPEGWDREYGSGLVNPWMAWQMLNQNSQSAASEPEENNSQSVEIEVPENEQEEMVQSLDTQVFTVDKNANSKNVFTRRERVYLKVVVNLSNGECVEGAEINVAVDYPSSSITRRFSGSSNEVGEWFEYIRKYSQRGEYGLRVTVDMEGFETEEWRGSFQVN